MNYCRKILACCVMAAITAGCSISGEKSSERGFTISEMEKMSAVYHKEYSDNHNITKSAVKELRNSQCIMRAITRSVNGAFAGMRTEWAVDVTRDCSMNTAVLAHGRLLISNCVVGKLHNQDQEAYIIAHAFAHTLLEHDNERITPYLAEKSKEKDYSFKQYLRSQGGYDVFIYNSITENISGHNLYDIFHELLSRKIQHFPFTKILLSILDWIGLKD